MGKGNNIVNSVVTASNEAGLDVKLGEVEVKTESRATTNVSTYCKVPTDTSVRGAPQANGWAHLMSGFYLEERGGTLLTEGELNLAGKAAYAVVVGYDDADGSGKVAATVGVWERGRFIGLVVIWPYSNPGVEPRLVMLKEIVGSISVA
ncbi:hypothetical protein [Arthrobacter sp. W4I7]|uniref:hypothetical protein n=1 Tax=Arthrobacter sp. W4I7 TaxID=3042296 RepID=UPI002788C3B8|nr:hypothetical protein [Arthrobacter sp. W4I7]MDQ0689240.1 hypothetical protein [Arthrobacter sp. W4I7]